MNIFFPGDINQFIGIQYVFYPDKLTKDIKVLA